MTNVSKGFLALKNNSKKNFDKLATELEKSGKFQADDRFWQPTIDKAGNGYAIIRFLPSVETEEVPFIKYWDHGFKGPGGWYIENSLTTLGKDDPVSEFNSELWNSTEDDKSPERTQARKQKRRLRYIANILVINDPSNTDNNGKVFLFRYGKKLHEKVNSAMFPKFPDQPRMNPFDMWEGANFRLRITKEDGYRSYNESKFDDPSAISNNDEVLCKIYESVYPLQPFIAPDKFKSYDELKARLHKVLGIGKKPEAAAAEEHGETPPPDFKNMRRPTREEKVKEEPSIPSAPPWDEDDDDAEVLEQFRRIANES